MIVSDGWAISFPHTLVKSRAERLWIFLLCSGFLNTSFERSMHTQYTVAKLESMKLRKYGNISARMSTFQQHLHLSISL